MNRKLLQLFQASMIAALLPLTGCLAEEPEDTDEEIASVEDELEVEVVAEEEGTSGEESDVLEEAVVEGADGLTLPEVDFVAFGETLPGGDRMAEPIPYPWDDPKGKTHAMPDDPSDPAPNQN